MISGFSGVAPTIGGGCGLKVALPVARGDSMVRRRTEKGGTHYKAEVTNGNGEAVDVDDDGDDDDDNEIEARLQ